ncbi:hypothetical protein L596_008413 [Steinernema carpocapsae]|uniref:DNA helicase n=1 Tax=Steinernema carpocapsae TaxID=34508 RepID=A0A4U5PCH8_STECR|nr:hypothetical protein L596_008413 [Steinernema carpocapsae]
MPSEDESSASSQSSSEEESNVGSPQSSKHDEESSSGESGSEFEVTEDPQADGGVTSSSGGDDREPPVKKSRRKRKLSEETLNLLHNSDLLRRSDRTRNVARKRDSESGDSVQVRSRKRAQKKLSDSEDSFASSDDASSDEEYKSAHTKSKASKKSTSKKGSSRSARNRFSSDEENSSDSASHRKSRRGNLNTEGKVDYRDASTDEEVNTDDVLEWEEEDAEAVHAPEIPHETVEKVLKHRMGLPGATGSSTTCYNVEDKGDPNTAAGSSDSSVLEQQYLVKWVGWSHLHNTWESTRSLKLANAKGLKKVENYLKRQMEIDAWRRTADKEYIEFFDCEQEMSEELYDQYKIVERVIAHQLSREQALGGVPLTEYFIKWIGLPYAESTWEDEALIRRNYADKIEDYLKRTSVKTLPYKSCLALHRRPKFTKLEGTPDFLKCIDNEQVLRDYQVDGVNWMLHAWTKGNSSILADEMGLGKTIQSISFLSSLFHLHEVYGPFLVVVPLSTMAAWQREFDNWAKDLNVVTYMGDVNSRDLIRQFELCAAPGKNLKANAILTTYEILLKDKVECRST